MGLYDLGHYLKRVRDLTIPNWGNYDDWNRQENRFNRALPMVLCPWENGKIDEPNTIYVLTKDVSNLGISLVFFQPVHVEQVVIGLYPDADDPSQPWFFVGNTRHLTEVGGGFWTMGVQLTEFLNTKYPSELEVLKPYAERLLPRSDVAEPAPEAATR